MAIVLVFLKVFSRRRATIKSDAPVSSTARKTCSLIFTRIQTTKLSSSEPPPYSSAGNFTSTPAAMRDLAIQASPLFLELDSSGEVLSPCGRFVTTFATVTTGDGTPEMILMGHCSPIFSVLLSFEL